MLEAAVEARLCDKLKAWGFEPVKLSGAGCMGKMDRMFLRPKYAPGPAVVVEVKRPGEVERPLQAARRKDWRARGVDVRDPVSTYDEVDALVTVLYAEVHTLRMAALKARINELMED